MPILRRRTNPTTTTQPAGQAAVPSQRDTQEGAANAQTAAEYSRGEATGTGAPAAQAAPRQAVAAETRPEARREDYYIGAILTILSGLVTSFMGITAIISGNFYNNVASFPFYYSVRSRGVTLLVIGAIAFLMGLALLASWYWARTGAIVVAVLSALANFMFLPYYPFWSVTVIALNVVIIWELARNRDRREYARLPAGYRVRVTAAQGRPT